MATTERDKPMEGAELAALEAPGLRLRAVLLVLAMMLVLAGSVLYLMWVRGAFEATQPLHLIADDSEGITIGSDLTFSGFPIGRVRDIRLVEGGAVRIDVDVAVKDAHWLRDSSVFTLERGLVGAARLRAFTGLPEDPPLPSGASRPVLRGDVSAQIPRMVADARDVLASVARVLNNLNRLTTANTGLRGTLARLDALVADLGSRSDSGGLLAVLTGDADDGRRVGQLLTRVDGLVQRLDASTEQASGRFLGKDGLGADLQATTRELQALLQDMRASVRKMDAILGQADEVTGNVRSASSDLDQLRSQVEDSLQRIDALVLDLNRRWPFNQRQTDIELP